ncbi:class I SAM-dependent methyltransferase [Clostridium botulinum]|uniref:class I SAM-dependent methyltransferase n=2 Tax=Clostridium botulinum TaxID=1491 RepID=UPI0007749E2B|nr:class I SAM-dependent methyltransferase [Clostridium botulinum]NFE93534.1 class I SAM-dependent methyltransferase [Clostridium botulinum]NFL35017.1 class I SAM-dependent methyltransferase [Clostridium botulinum]NFL38095.1 class I SAM-dependent methyltransferase [Clostridium botulinum]NFL64417.1 class I SAM-dependent methyltransferase [Clostridium botulinum]NFM04596.1 class I SAM-dependent methyltransferase [Clostridium botulinum]
MNYDELKELWEKEEDAAFKGWDFSYLKNRWDDEELPWNYKDILKKYLNSDYKLLDMGTGGGEFLLTINHPYSNTSVTEMWKPNFELCKQKLEPLGIEVKQAFNDSKLPFEDNTFDMIINRHESFNIKEVRRILKPNGIFVTQQVGGKNNEVLSNVLIKDFKPLYSENTLDNNLRNLEKNSFEILYSKEYFPYLRFKDIGAIVYFAKIIEWEFPNFSVENCFDKLCKLNEEINVKGYIESIEHRFIIVCRKQN